MTVHINGSKGKELYYNGVKIKEAYYNGNKVYSSGPLYYCYKYTIDIYGTIYNYYFYTKSYYNPYPPIGTTVWTVDQYGSVQATKSSDLVYTSTIQSTDGLNRYQQGDLYT